MRTTQDKSVSRTREAFANVLLASKRPNTRKRSRQAAAPVDNLAITRQIFEQAKSGLKHLAELNAKWETWLPSLTWEEAEHEGIQELMRIHKAALEAPISDADFARAEQVVRILDQHPGNPSQQSVPT